MKYTLQIPEIVYRDIFGIQSYISKDNPAVAKKMVKKIYEAIESLAEGLYLGIELKKKFDVESNLRFCIVKPYIILFKIDESIIKIYRVLDGRSDYLVRIGLKADENEQD